MPHNSVPDAGAQSTQPSSMATHFAVANISRSSTRSPSPSSPTTSFGEGSFSSTSSTNTTINHERRKLPEPPIFTGLSTSTVNFKDWSTLMLAKLNEMADAKVEEKDKMEYVVAHTGREAFQRLLGRLEEMKGKGVAFGSARPMVLYLAQYYDEHIRMLDIRFSPL